MESVEDRDYEVREWSYGRQDLWLGNCKNKGQTQQSPINLEQNRGEEKKDMKVIFNYTDTVTLTKVTNRQ